ncbi:MAG: thiamine pyrophosphate-binding protein [Chloroflexi bacterium]|nr:thiamine pyrophosphate-binding protein [Chloroflexota bacterium]
MAAIRGGQLVVKCLKKEGVKYLFSLTGHGVHYMFDACNDEGIQVIGVRHEEAAAHMADGWSRVTRQPGIVAAPCPPGAACMAGGIAAAYESSRVVAISGHTPLKNLDMFGDQELDTLGMMRPITKWARTVCDARRIPEYISQAFRYTLSGPPGPVYLNIPQDVLETVVDDNIVLPSEGYRTEARYNGDPVEVSRAVGLLLSAERPLIVGGSGVFWSDAGEELRQLIEMARIPLVLWEKARGSVPEDHPLCFGPAMVGLAKADVIMVVGTRFDHRLEFGRAPFVNEKAKIIQIDIDAGVIGKNRRIEVGIAGDAKAVLKQMVEEARDRCRGRQDLPWVKEHQGLCNVWRQRLEAGADSNAVPIHPARLMKEVSGFLDRDAIIACDGGYTGVLGETLFRVYHPGHLLDHHHLGKLGTAVPFGVAAKLAKPANQVLVFTGDGAFGYNGMEVDTAIRYKVPIVVVIANNGCWVTCRNRMLKNFGRTTGIDLGFSRYDKMVEAFGGHGEWVERPEDIRPALQRAFASGLPACVNVKIDPTICGDTTYGSSLLALDHRK